MIPNSIDDAGETFPGGTISGDVCWRVASDDVGSLVMIMEESFTLDDARAIFNLEPPWPEGQQKVKSFPEILVYSGCAQLAVDSCGEVEKCRHEPPDDTFLDVTSRDYGYLQTAITLKQSP